MAVNPGPAPVEFRCGRIVIAGRPNVGKSTLLNRILGRKLSITSRKPQTTRWCLLGIKTGPACQFLYVDTPGIEYRHFDSLNRHMRRELNNALACVDVVLLVIEAMRWTEADAEAATSLRDVKVPVLLVINKIDKLRRRAQLLPFMADVAAHGVFTEIVPVSARKGENIVRLERAVQGLLPQAPPAYPEEQLTDRSTSFLVAEMIREKLTRKLGAELPYRLAVTVDRFHESANLVRIQATVWVESTSQKAIVVGKGGTLLKSAGTQARADMEKLLGRRVFLRTWVKVRHRWTDDSKALGMLGYST